jgi:20S proteasome subunit beta 3
MHQEPEDLFETISQTLLNAVDRDAYSGWGAIVHVMWVSLPQSKTQHDFHCRTPNQVITRTLKGRMD